MSSKTGKRIRLARLIEAETNTCLICAIDHGMISPRFLPGLYDTDSRLTPPLMKRRYASPSCMHR